MGFNDGRGWHGNHRKGAGEMRRSSLRGFKNMGRSKRRSDNRGGNHSLIRCDRLRGFGKMMSGERFSRCWRNNRIMGYNHQRGPKNGRRSEEGRLGSHWRNDDLIGCNGLGGCDNKRSDRRRYGNTGRNNYRLVPDGLDGRGRRCDKLRRFEGSGTGTMRLGCRDGLLAGER